MMLPWRFRAEAPRDRRVEARRSRTDVDRYRHSREK